MCKVSSKEDQNIAIDYIYCLSYVYSNVELFKQCTLCTLECNLDTRQRSSQQILDLADYLHMHQTYYNPIRSFESSSSFCSEIPLWIELDKYTNFKSFFDYFKSKYDCNDVMLVWDMDTVQYYWRHFYNIDIEEFCRIQNWKCTETMDVRGSEASITILFNLDDFHHEYITRAKNQLVIVTIIEYARVRYVLPSI